MTTYNLTQLQKFTGYSRVKLTSDETIRLLKEAGSNLEGTGAKWEVTTDQLIAAGLIDKNGTPFPVKKRAPRSGHSAVRSQRTKFPQIEASTDLEWLSNELEDAKTTDAELSNELKTVQKKLKELTELQRREREIKTRQAESASRMNAAQKRFDAVAAQVEEEISRIEKNREVLERLRAAS